VDDIRTTVPDLSDFYGTSAAAASLAGVAALILSANPDLTPAQVEQIMEATALPMTNSAVSGAGLVQVDPAVAEAISLLVPSTPAVTADYAHDTHGGSFASTGAGVLANDSDSDRFDVLSVSAVDGSAADVGQAVNGVFGALTLNSDGSYTYTNTHPGLVALAGGVAEDMFGFTVSNGDGGTANSTLTVLITSSGDTYLNGAAGSTIVGESGPTALDGSAGDMNVQAGNSGHQWLFGGNGDTLTGGSSADTFMFAPGFGEETINNFNTAHDVIDLPASLVQNFATVQADMHMSGANTVITVDGTDAITLSNVAAQNLQAHNFHFVV
jgi:VCBS repeat-containing protein